MLIYYDNEEERKCKTVKFLFWLPWLQLDKAENLLFHLFLTIFCLQESLLEIAKLKVFLCP